MDSLFHDLRYATRRLRQSPAFTSVAVLCLALGIGANTAMFGLVDVYRLRELPFDRDQRLVQVWATDTERRLREVPLSAPDFLAWRERSRSLELAAYRDANLNLADDAEPERLAARYVSANVFAVMNAGPALGRGFLPSEEAAPAARAVVLSHGFWERRYGSDPAVIGRRIVLDGAQHDVVGVLPQDFRFPGPPTDVWVPLGLRGDEDGSARSLLAIGRLRTDATVAQALAELQGTARQRATAYAATHAAIGARVLPLREQLYGSGDLQEVLILMVAAAFVLLIACANVTNLLLVRGVARRREIAVRRTLGAGRLALLRQLLTESLLLALLGAVGGVMLSFWALDALVRLLPLGEWRIQLLAQEVGVNGRVLAYTLLIAFAAAAAAGLVPALEASGAAPGELLRDDARGATAGPRRSRLRSGLVIFETALALMLLISAGLLLKGYATLQRWDAGFDTQNVLTMRVALPQAMHADSAQVLGFFRESLQRIEALPGVSRAGAVTALPGPYNTASTTYELEGEPPATSAQETTARWYGASPDYFTALGIALVAGRPFTASDGPDTAPVVLINQAMARRHWGDGQTSPIGRRIVLPSGPRQIIGIVRDTRESGPQTPATPTLYMPAYQRAYAVMTLVARTVDEPLALADAVRAEIRHVLPDQPVYNVRTLDAAVRQDREGLAILPAVLAVFGLVALLLAMLGVYGIMSYVVSQRRQEIGVRMALGAGFAEIIALFAKQAVRLTLTGIMIGLLLSMLATRGLGWLLFGISPLDPATYLLVTGTLALTAFAATWIPVRRASRVDPMAALRAE